MIPNGNDELIRRGDRICVLERQLARRDEEMAELRREFADLQQKNGDLLHLIDDAKWGQNHAIMLLEKERAKMQTPVDGGRE